MVTEINPLPQALLVDTPSMEQYEWIKINCSKYEMVARTHNLNFHSRWIALPGPGHIILRDLTDQAVYTLVWGDRGTYYLVDDAS